MAKKKVKTDEVSAGLASLIPANPSKHKPKIDVDDLHKKHQSANTTRKREGSRDFKKHLQPDFNIDVKSSYAVSAAAADKHPDPDVAHKHLESLLKDGIFKFDR